MIKKLFLLIAVTFGLGTPAAAAQYIIHWPNGHVIVVVPDRRPKPKPHPKPHVDIRVWHPYYHYHYRPYYRHR